MNQNKLVVFMGMAFELVGLIVASALLGHWIDQQMHWPGFALAGLSIVGLISWLTHIVVLIQGMDKSEESDKEQK